ncbi:MAG: zinc transporter ZupT [Candidatus Micrarchaeota archaeon]|nr:zinc transporter ZupT [Candidatus Micrarchaeota archaeon]
MASERSGFIPCLANSLRINMEIGMESWQVLFPLLLAFLAGISTSIGGLACLAVRRFDRSLLAFGLGMSAGVMIYVSFTELLASAIAQAGFFRANAAFFGGMVVIMLADFLIPHFYIAEKVCGGWQECRNAGWNAYASGKRQKGGTFERRLAVAGALVALGIAIHNVPEGVAVFLGGISDISLGIALAFAIALHNIPEGVAIALPVYYSTKSRLKAFLCSFAAGFAEPIGAVLGALFLLPIMNPQLLSLSLAFAGGIMVFISFDELLPICFEGRRSGHFSIIGIIIGMALMAASLHLL